MAINQLMSNSIKLTVLFGICAGLSLAGACSSSSATRPTRLPIESACTGLSDADRLAAVDGIKSNVSGVDQILVSPCCKAPLMRPSGATLYVRAIPGATAEWLERVVVCDAKVQGAAPACAGRQCPVALSGERVSVSAMRGGFAIAVRSDDVQTAQHIWERAEGFVR